jgi:S1-C subfamily serine protease
VQSDDDDEADAFGGPPPDPSLRAWRHPSEIAAAAAAANREAASHSSPSRPFMPSVAAFVGVGLIAAAAVGIVTLTGAFDSTPEATFLDAEGASHLTTTSGGALLTTSLAPSLPASSSTSATTTSEQATTTTTATADTMLGPATESEPTQHWSADLDPTLIAWDGVFTDDPVAPIRLGDFTVVNEVVFTSAATIEGRGDLGLVIDGQWIVATPLLIDACNDVAMLDIPDEDLAFVLAASDSVWTVTDDYQSPTPGTKISITDLDLAQSTATTGTVIASDERAVISTGKPVYGSIITTAHRPDGSSGGAMVDHKGNLIGLIVDSDGTLTAAVPADRLVAIKDSFDRWGVAANEWIGIEGKFRSTRGAILTVVAPGGPADLAGLRQGNIITSVDGTTIIDWAHLVHLIREAGTGTSIELTIGSEGQESIVTVTVGSSADRPDPDASLVASSTGSETGD